MTDQDYRAILGFTDEWFSLGIMTNALLQEHIAAYEAGDDESSEHYRFGAFRRYLREHRPLSEAMSDALYDLGASDPDVAMGGSMMADIVSLPECPETVLDKAVASRQKHLVKLVERRRLLAELPADIVPQDLFTRCLAVRDSVVHEALLEKPGLSTEQVQTLAEQGATRRIHNMASVALRRKRSQARSKPD